MRELSAFRKNNRSPRFKSDFGGDLGPGFHLRETGRIVTAVLTPELIRQ